MPWADRSRPPTAFGLCLATCVALGLLLPGVGRTAPSREGLSLGKAKHCSGLYAIAGTELCTHGPDPAPGGFDIGRDVPPVKPREGQGRNGGEPDQPEDVMVPTSLITVTCEGDGTSGPRVQVLYVRASDRPDRYSQYLASMQQWSAETDAIFFDSAAATGGVRRVRFVHDGGCQVVVANVVIAPNADDSFGAMINALSQQGYNRNDRKYLIFADATVYCGIGTLVSDDRAIAGNLNNNGPSYARVDAGCWSGDVAAHELMHNFGGVQNSSPHASGGNHCTDEYDRMCYSDAPYYPTMASVCQPAVPNDRLLDCNHDDYYHTNPTPGSYLASHWNSAASVYLLLATSTPSPTPTPSLGPVLVVAGVDGAEQSGNGNGNGLVEPGEQAAITVTLHNSGTLAANGISGTLGVQLGQALIAQGTVGWPNIPVGQDAASSQPFTVFFSPTQACGGLMRFGLAVQYAGTAALTDAVSFRTGQEHPLGTQTDAYGGPPVSIPDDNIVGIHIPLTLTAPGGVTDLDLGFNLSHTWDGDMDFYLEAPDGDAVPLILNRGNEGHNFNGTILDDEAQASIANGVAPFTGRYRPEYPLALMDDKPVAGAWKLLAVDVGPQDLGTLTALTLTVASRRFDCDAILRGDCNGDAALGAADVSALVLEIFDGDGSAPEAAFGGSYHGRPLGCNANADAQIDAADLACLVRRLYGAPNCP